MPFPNEKHKSLSVDLDISRKLHFEKFKQNRFVGSFTSQSNFINSHGNLSFLNKLLSGTIEGSFVVLIQPL